MREREKWVDGPFCCCYPPPSPTLSASPSASATTATCGSQRRRSRQFQPSSLSLLSLNVLNGCCHGQSDSPSSLFSLLSTDPSSPHKRGRKKLGFRLLFFLLLPLPSHIWLRGGFKTQIFEARQTFFLVFTREVNCTFNVIFCQGREYHICRRHLSMPRLPPPSPLLLLL
jgi:hypothetical protein